VPAAALAHVRQHGLRHGQSAEQVRLHHSPELGVGQLFEGADQAVSRAVDQHVDAAGRDGSGDDVAYLRAVGHVEGEHGGGRVFGEVGECCGVPGRCDDGIARGQHRLSDGAAEPRGRAGDQPTSV